MPSWSATINDPHYVSNVASMEPLQYLIPNYRDVEVGMFIAMKTCEDDMTISVLFPMGKALNIKQTGLWMCCDMNQNAY